MIPSAYNNNMQLFQTAAYVVILNEMVHDARIVPLDRRLHLPEDVRQWMGDARGHWDGDTLSSKRRASRTGRRASIPRSPAAWARARRSRLRSGSGASMRTRSSTNTRSTTRRRIHDPLRSGFLCGNPSCRYSNTRATRATTAWWVCSLERGQKRRPPPGGNNQRNGIRTRRDHERRGYRPRRGEGPQGHPRPKWRGTRQAPSA